MAPGFYAHDWYDSPEYYERVFEGLTAAEVEFVEAMYERYRVARARRARRIFEPACGAGRLVEPLARRGYAVSGFDISEPMLEFARQRLAAAGLTAHLINARLERFALRGRFELAYSFVSSFKYLLDEDAARSHLEHVAAHLIPGGVYLLGFHLSEYGDASIDRERHVSDHDGMRVVANITSWPPDRRTRLEDVRLRLVVARDGCTRRYETRWQFRAYSARQFRALLATVPALELVAVHDFDYRVDATQRLGEQRLDTVAVLRNRG